MKHNVYLEPSPLRADGGAQVGKLPASIELRDLRDLGHPASPLRAIRAKCVDCSGGNEATGELSPAGSQTTSSVPAAHFARETGQGGRFHPLASLNRRSVIATMMAVFAPAAGTAMVLPKVISTTAAAIAGPMPPAEPVLTPTTPTESPELLALGAELEIRLEAYRVAASRLAEARVVAASLWPEPSAGILVTASNHHIRNEPGRYHGCYAEETDPEGNQWPEIAYGAGRGSPLPRYVALWSALSSLLDRVRAEPAEWADGFAQELVERVKEAERYEYGCNDALEASEIEERKEEAEACVEALYDLVTQVEMHPPRTIAGVLIHARALAGYADVDKDGFQVSAPMRAATILGRELADAVLRVAGVAS